MTDGQASDPEDPDARRRLTRISSDRARVAALAGTGMVVAVMQTVVTPIYPQLPEYLDAAPADITWVLSATLLAAVVSTPISTRLGDMYGKRRVLLVLLGIVVAGNVLAGFSNELTTMIVARVLQGTGLGAIALGISILRDILHPRSLSGAVALVSATLGIGGAIGLPVAALIAEHFDWHALFWLGAMLSTAAGIAVLAVVPPSTLRAGGRFDLVGAIGAGVGLTSVTLAISKAQAWGWWALLLALAAAPVFAWWARRELRVADPFVDLRVAARRPVLLTNLASVGVGFSFFVVTGSLPVILEAEPVEGVGFGLDLFTASLCLMPLGVVMFLVSPLAGRLSRARGARFSFLLGIAVIVAGFAFGALFLDEVWHVIAVSTFTGIGVGFAYGAMPTLIMAAVPSSETAAANGLNSLMRTFGSTLSATVVGAIIAASLSDGGLQRWAFETIFALGAAVACLSLLLASLVPAHLAAGRRQLG
ncbi:MFS transporter [Homoserinibacter sp. GY 40078]|uniref:MFS transporter n=1 Tax=Homoserinibacter sp. GY 40078 TaxID=2603275 RepID=UPI0011C8BB08|nr:MFS transporter [Homoserinibacter sp. GY 40078]TXK19310.1 MFS transporter [Homoserinibacter sp. GY 40078]